MPHGSYGPASEGWLVVVHYSCCITVSMIGASMFIARVPLQDSYNVLQKYDIKVSQDDIERVDALRYMWYKLQEQVCSVETTLIQIQPVFRKTLLVNVVSYQTEVAEYTHEYDTVSSGKLVSQTS